MAKTKHASDPAVLSVMARASMRIANSETEPENREAMIKVATKMQEKAVKQRKQLAAASGQQGHEDENQD